ncbi:response regulator transcription factor [Candidatus Dojkabacteria bacterium]|nr:response regulator transcription factor [Candidatus Dojkabacteria bacterium]
MNKILVIQDSPAPQPSKIINLIPSEQYELRKISKEQISLVKYCNFDLIILDSSLNGDKVLVCRRLRKDGVGQPVLAILEKQNRKEKIEILNLGADEVVDIGIDSGELKAHIDSLLRRPPAFYIETIRIDNLILDICKREVRRAKQKVKLSGKEFGLLFCLVKNRNTTVGRDSLFEKVWGMDSERYLNIVDVYIRYLRKKVDDGFKKKLIKTVYGIGYKIEG